MNRAHISSAMGLANIKNIQKTDECRRCASMGGMRGSGVIGVSAPQIDFLKRHDLTACDIPTCIAHSGDHNAPWYTLWVILLEATDV